MKVKDEEQTRFFENDGFILVVHPYLVPEIRFQQLVCFCKFKHMFIKIAQEAVLEILI